MKYKNRFEQEAKPIIDKVEFYALMCKSSFGQRLLEITKNWSNEKEFLNTIYVHSMKTCSIKKNIYYRVNSICRELYCKVKGVENLKGQRQKLYETFYKIKLKEGH
ncbi:hypothetical protein [Flammeovirga sp. EKP202]|uniref:hypothetical protein n=1 Tax=Flammeovirga sp. EKP202 TaxID=2770592 RepID=UPI00165F5D2E|nr:hypothetical protein [Flammeovirga sp. EKP202]MBD0402917.1 hypothetical protein [Flammeovirga sp. EKP202]